MMYNEYQNLKALNLQQLSAVEDIFSNFLRKSAILQLNRRSAYELHHEKSNNLNMQKQNGKVISAFAFTTQIVQSLFFLNPKPQASGLFL